MSDTGRFPHRNFGMDFTRKLSFLVFLLCVLISLKHQNDENNKKAENNRKGNVDFSDLPSLPRNPLTQGKLQVNRTPENRSLEWLRYDYYNESCPLAEQIIRSTIRELFELRSDVAPAVLRLAFHDCFVGVTNLLPLVSIFHGLLCGVV